MAPHSNDAPYCPLPSCKKLETFNGQFPRKCPKTRIFLYLIPLNPRIKTFFQNCGRVTFLLYWPTTSCKVSEKINDRSLRYLKTDRLKAGQPDKGDYYGPQRVNPGSKKNCLKRITSEGNLSLTPEGKSIVLSKRVLKIIVWKGTCITHTWW